MARREINAMVRKVEAGKEELIQCLRRIHERRRAHSEEARSLDEDEARCHAAYYGISQELTEFLGKHLRKSKS